MSQPGARADQGGGTVLAGAATGIVVVVLAGGLALVSAVDAAHRARAGADLAALAGATAVQAGASAQQVCLRSAAVAAANAAQQGGCVVGADGAVTVETTAPVGLALPGLGRLRARATARAGPAPSL